MNQNELTKLLKPIVRQLVKEAMQQELSTVITEIIKQTSSNNVVESKKQVISQPLQNERLQEKQKAMTERKRTLEEMSKKAYGGINIFEGTTPISSAGNPEEKSAVAMADPLAGTDPNDPGVNIDGLLRMTGGWKIK